MQQLTEQELIELELEKRSCIDTANEMSIWYIDTEISAMVDTLRTKAQHIQDFQDYLRQNTQYAETMQKITDAIKNAK